MGSLTWLQRAWHACPVWSVPVQSGPSLSSLVRPCPSPSVRPSDTDHLWASVRRRRCRCRCSIHSYSVWKWLVSVDSKVRQQHVFSFSSISFLFTFSDFFHFLFASACRIRNYIFNVFLFRNKIYRVDGTLDIYHPLSPSEEISQYNRSFTT